MKVFKHLFLALIIISLAACGNPTIEKVKSSTLAFNKDIKIGETLDKYSYFKSKSWERIDTDTDDKIVQFKGKLPWSGQNFGKTDMMYDNAFFIVQFTVSPDSSVKISKIEIERDIVHYGVRIEPLEDKKNEILNALYSNTDIFSKMM